MSCGSLPLGTGSWSHMWLCCPQGPIHNKCGKSHHKNTPNHRTHLLQALLHSQQSHRARLAEVCYMALTWRTSKVSKWMMFSQRSAFPGPCSQTLLNLYTVQATHWFFQSFCFICHRLPGSCKITARNFLYLYFKTCLLFCLLLGLRTGGRYRFKYLIPA